MARETLILLGICPRSDRDREELRRRCAGAARWYGAHPHGQIIACGGATGDLPVSEAAEMKRSLIGMGVPETDIIMEDSSRITRENLTNALALLDDADRESLYLATSDYHMPRALLTLRRCGGRARAYRVRILPSGDKLRKMFFELLYTVDLLMGHQDAGARRPAWTRAIMRLLRQDKP
ncbi:MAG: YdcF family protein [Clostridiales bacterium]|nr:YdcF family protein [Clostridiales bacterium]